MYLELHVITTLIRNYVFRTTSNYDFKTLPLCDTNTLPYYGVFYV